MDHELVPSERTVMLVPDRVKPTTVTLVGAGGTAGVQTSSSTVTATTQVEVRLQVSTKRRVTLLLPRPSRVPGAGVWVAVMAAQSVAVTAWRRSGKAAWQASPVADSRVWDRLASSRKTSPEAPPRWMYTRVKRARVVPSGAVPEAE